MFWTRCRIKAFVRMECRLLVSCLVLLACGSLAMLPVLTHVHSKFEYKYSFKGPYLINSRGNIPFWTHGGSEGEGGRGGRVKEREGEGGRGRRELCVTLHSV